MRNLIGDVLDDIGCFFARYNFDYIGALFAKCAEAVDSERVED